MSAAFEEKVAQALEQEFGAFLAHDPHKPERFWPSTARGVLGAVLPDWAKVTAQSDAWEECNAKYADLAATLERVRALHRKGSMHFVAGDCSNEECDHEDACPEEPRDVCSECWERAEEISPYFAEGQCPAWVMWPCPTIAALAAPSDPATDTGGEGRG